ncbi:sigma-70 family RNA polymerase sigma factor [Arthrobacter pigmenti]
MSAATEPDLSSPVEEPRKRPVADVDARMELEELLKRAGRGDAVALAGVYARTVSRVYGVVSRVIHNHALSEETVQDVYVQVWSGAHTYNPGLGSPIGWIVTIAHRRAVDTVRSERNHRDRNTKYGLQTQHCDDPVTGLIDRLAAAQSLSRCWHTLTDLQRESIELAYYGGLTGTEIGAALGVKASTVKTRIRDGILRLRAGLTERQPHHQGQHVGPHGLPPLPGTPEQGWDPETVMNTGM